MAANPKPLLTSTKSPDAFHKEISDAALELSRNRKAQAILLKYGLDFNRFFDSIPSTLSECESDWSNAIIALATHGLGKSYTLHSLSSACFRHFEGVWLEDLKKSIAYYHWLDEKNEPHAEMTRLRCYFQACKELRDCLATENKPSGPDGALEYLCATYLNSQNSLDRGKTHELISSKSEKLREWVPDPGEVATRFVYTFYSNIYKAITTGNAINVIQVLKAVQNGGSSPCNPSIINSYEALLLILFVDGKIVTDIWENQASGINREATM